MTCPYCLQSKPKTTSSTFSPDAISEHDLDAAIERTEGLILRLVIKRSKLFKKRNEMRSPIYSLPPEILSVIFKLTCPPLDFLHRYGLHRTRQFSDRITYPRIIGVLSAVSARWHDVVLSTPHLWTSFIADDRDMRLMRSVFARSGNLPVSVSVNTLRNISPSYKVHPIDFAEISQEYGSRVRWLYVRGNSFKRFNQHASNFVDLEVLSLSNDAMDDGVVEVNTSCPYLVLSTFKCRFSLSWSKVKVLHLNGLPVDVCLEMLEKCTNLIEYRALHLSEPVGGIELPNSPFVLPCLKLFEWVISVGRREAADRAMLQYCRMPALQTLVWSSGPISVELSDAVSTFFENLPSMLTAVRVLHCVADKSPIFHYCLNLSNIEHLTFRFCDDSFLDDVFHVLGSQARWAGNQVMPVLPKLESIHIRYFVGSFDQANFLQALRRRYSTPLGLRPGRLLRLEFEPDRVDWTYQFKKGMIEMVEEGHQVELWECFKPVDWLPR